MEGWIKLSKKLLSWEWFDRSEMVHLFIYCLLKANFEPKKWHGIIIERGSFITSRQKIKSETRLSERTIRTCIERLISTNEVTVKTTKQFTIVTISKYEDYQIYDSLIDQQNDQVSDQRPTNDRPTTDQRPTYTKEYKNNIYKEINKEKRKVFQKPTIEEIQSYVIENNYTLDAEYFFNWYESKGWMVGKTHMKDWKAAIRTWQQRDKQKNPLILQDNSTDKFKNDKPW